MIKIKFATGRAKCQHCLKLINKNDLDLVIIDYNSIKQYHLNCIKKLEKKFIKDFLNFKKRYKK